MRLPKSAIVAALAVLLAVSPLGGAAADSHTNTVIARSSASTTGETISGTVSTRVGVAVDARETTGESALLVASNFDQMTAENHLKPDAWYGEDRVARLHPDAERIMDFAVANALDVHGHTLVWHSQTPDWFFLRDDGADLTSSDEDKQTLRIRMHEHIHAVASSLAAAYGPFGGGNPVVSFDVVNEAISDDGQPSGLRQSPWFRVLGEEYIDLAFRYADEAFNHQFAAPGADRPVLLVLNDYNTEVVQKRARLLTLVERLRARGTPPRRDRSPVPRRIVDSAR